MTKKFYKVLDENGSARMGRGKWHLPRGSRPGKWMPLIKGKLVPCQNGYHLCRRADLVEWLGATIYEAEYRGEMIESDAKIIVREARLIRRIKTWNETTARLFACDCTARALKHFGAKYPNDKRPQTAIQIARKFARGEATAEKLNAARAAAWDAARAAAWDAARAAERRWQTKRLFEYLDGKKSVNAKA